MATTNVREAHELNPIETTTRPDMANQATSTEHVSPQENTMSSFFRIFRYSNTTDYLLNAIAVLCMMGAGTLLPLMEILFGKFVTTFNDFARGTITSGEYRSEVNKYSLWFVYLFIAKFVLVYIWTTLIATTAVRTTKNIRLDFMRQCLRQDISFFESSKAGSMASQGTVNGNLINQGISERLGLIIQSLTTFIAAFAIAFAIQWKLALITLSIVPPIFVVMAVCVSIDSSHESQLMSIYSRGGSIAEEVFSSIRNIHAFWAYNEMSQRLKNVLNEAYRIGCRKSPNYSVLFSVEYFCIYCGYGLAFWQGVRMYASGEIKEPGKIVTVIFTIVVAAQALTQVAPQLIQISKAAAAAHELFQTIDSESKIDSLSTDGNRPGDCRGAIELENVSFAYPSRPDVPVLDRFSLSIPENKTTALVGMSGSGKSTVIGLLERWYKPLSGTISLDEHRIEDLNIQWLRSHVRLVQQEPVLFEGTIFQNVEYGLAGTAMEDVPATEKRKLVEDACRAAFAHDFISELSDGYDTRIGQRGATLSGGQKQRITIARSIISNPRVLLLDEATSALDPEAEKVVQKALNNVAAGRTMVVIAHRLSTIRNADNIVVMASGNIVEQGTHDELINQGGQYASYVKVQNLAPVEASIEHQSELLKAEESEVDTCSETHEASQYAPIDNPMESKQTSYNIMQCIAIIVREQRTLWPLLSAMISCCIIGGFTFPALAVLFARLIHTFQLETGPMRSKGDFYALMFLVIALGNLGVYSVLGWLCNSTAQRIMRYYRQEIFDNTMRQPISFFDQPSNSTGALASRLSTEPQNITELMSMNAGLIVLNISGLVSSVVLSLAVGWKFGLVLLFGALLPLVFSGYLRMRLEYKLDQVTAERFAASAGLASEAILAIRTVASLTLERVILKQYQTALSGIASRSLAGLGYTMFWYALSQSISFLAMALGFWYGGRLNSTGEYSTTQFYVVFLATIFSGEGAALLFQYTSSIVKAKGAVNYIVSLRSGVVPDMLQGEMCHLHDGGSDGDADNRPAAAVEARQLGFSYPQRPSLRVLENVNVDIPPGKFVAFVGPSGSGKSTIIALLERFYDPTSGGIRIDDEDISRTPLSKHRKKIALVQQEPILYQGSIRDNITLGLGASEPPSKEEVLAAASQANIHDFILSLPEGLNTRCGSLGMELSGGQRQRIAIARALIRKPRLLLLDEATSALDSQSEDIVKQALDNATQKRTTVAVAHRLSTIRDAHCIFVLSNGRIAEAGSHDELLRKQGIYYSMCLGQGLE